MKDIIFDTYYVIDINNYALIVLYFLINLIAAYILAPRIYGGNQEGSAKIHLNNYKTVSVII